MQRVAVERSRRCKRRAVAPRSYGKPKAVETGISKLLRGRRRRTSQWTDRRAAHAVNSLPLKGGGLGWGSPLLLKATVGVGLALRVRGSKSPSFRRMTTPAPHGNRSLRFQLRNFHGNHFQHARNILYDVGIPKSENRHASLSEPLISLSIPRCRFCVLTAVELDGELKSRTIEIQDVISGRMLPSKACAIDLRVSELLPQPPLDVGNVPP